VLVGCEGCEGVEVMNGGGLFHMHGLYQMDAHEMHVHTRWMCTRDGSVDERHVTHRAKGNSSHIGRATRHT
jgi:hypothetical protein